MSPLAWIGLGLLVAPRAAHGLARLPRRRRRATSDEVITFGTLLALGLSAGLPLAAAIAAAADEVDGPLRAPIDALVRNGRAAGLAVALVEAEGPLAGLASRLARAQVSGAPMADAVATWVRSERGGQRQRRLEKARTLPVALIVPISLLLLPGFLALVVGPTLVEQLGSLLGPLIGP